WYQKQSGEFDPTQEEEYERIHMPKNTPTGIYVSAWALAFGFAMIWYIWWLAAASLVGIVVTCIQHSYNDDVDYYVEVEEIKAIEAARRAQLEEAKKQSVKGDNSGRGNSADGDSDNNKNKDDLETTYAS
ncbi:MAG: cytochrome o ubiquinol oxidase subunit I, partial [Vibrio toranzoniae]